MAEERDKGLKVLRVVPRNISVEMRESYLDYAMSVITARALPDVRDGLKPVHRRILYAMHEMGLTAAGRFRKSAAVVGDVLGKYHPHGDVPVYDALVKMAQVFSFRYPLIIGQGNFGSVDGDAPAAMRYTEAKMSRISGEILRDIERETVGFRPNYDSTRKEPVVLPAAVPNLLLNGTLGIAVGMATNIPPHNLKEVIEATVYLIDHPESTTEDLLRYIKGPDFPTGGVAFNVKDIHHAYASGRGPVVVRGEAEIVESKTGQFQIVITSIPYRVNKAELIVSIADLVREKKIEGIKGLRDESTRNVHIVIELKPSSFPEKILNFLYKHTQLEVAFHYNCVALVRGVPETLSLKAILKAFIDHRVTVVKRRSQFDLSRAEERLHILLGLSKAIEHIDRIIKLIKSSPDVPAAHGILRKEFGFSDRQATAILELKLQRLAALEREKIEGERRQTEILIKNLKDLLASPKEILSLIKKELKTSAEKYADERKTKIVTHGVKEYTPEDLIPDEESMLVLTKGGYIKRIDPEEYRKQRRGGIGVVDLETKEEDFVTHAVATRTHNDILFFTDKGKVYQIKMYELPEGRRATRGKSIANFLALPAAERITSVLPMPRAFKREGLSLFMVTKRGIGKKVVTKSFHDVRRSGLLAIKLAAGDELIAARFVEKGDEMILATTHGQSIRFRERDVREMGRAAAGVRVIRVSRGDAVVGADVVKQGVKGASFLVITERGFGKKTKITEYKVQRRGGSGIKTARLTSKTGNLIASRVVVEGEVTEVIAISKKSQVIRVDVKEISELRRTTQGVRVMKLRAGDALATLTSL